MVIQISRDSAATHRPDNTSRFIKYFDHHVTDKWSFGSLGVPRAVNKRCFLAWLSRIITHRSVISDLRSQLISRHKKISAIEISVWWHSDNSGSIYLNIQQLCLKIQHLFSEFWICASHIYLYDMRVFGEINSYFILISLDNIMSLINLC